MPRDPDAAIFGRCLSLPTRSPPCCRWGAFQNTLRNYAPTGRPVAVGIIAVADAYGHTDPTFALGLSMSLVHARLWPALLRRTRSEPVAMATDYFAATFPEAAERYALATASRQRPHPCVARREA